jgi:hypothetical protein
MKNLFIVFLLVLIALSAVALWLKPVRVHNGKIVLSYACVEFWAKPGHFVFDDYDRLVEPA